MENKFMVIPLTIPFLGEREIDEIRSTFKSGWVAGQGPKSKELENKFAKYVGAKHAICVNNCTAGLHLALLAAGIKAGDEVIIPDFTFPATAHSVMYTGAKPVFVDIDLNTYNIDPSLIESAINEKTKAIMPVHGFGLCCDMNEINRIAKKHNLIVIEDAACAIGAKYKDNSPGNLGDIGCFSFHGRKNLTCGEGGIITTNNSEFAQKIRSLSCFGMVSAFDRQEGTFSIPEFVEVGYNYKLSDISAAIVIAQLEKSDDFVHRKNELARYYEEKIKKVNGITTPHFNKDNIHSYQSYVVLLDNSINRNQVIVNMRKKGIQTQIGTYAMHRQPVYQKITNCDKNNFPNADHAFDQNLALPMFYELTFDQIDTIVDALRGCINESKK